MSVAGDSSLGEQEVVSVTGDSSLGGQTLGTAWERFWFNPEATSTLALVRILFGVVSFGWTLSLASDLGAFFGRAGLLATGSSGAGVWGVLAIFPSDLAVQLLFVVLLIASIALIAGYHTRIAALVVFVGILSFERRNFYVFNTGDGLLKVLAFYLMLAPAGASLSLDRWRSARERFWEFPARAPCALRLMQIQLSVLYISGLWVKVQGTTWNNGTAVGYAMRISDVTRLPLPPFLLHSGLMSNLMTYGTLAIEASVPILVWNRRLRPWAILAGVCLHVGIGWSIRVGFFTGAMLTLYLSFLDPAWAQSRLLGLRDRWQQRSGAGARPGARGREAAPQRTL
ncbi:MAG: HTTM domain-containing protein [Solirubrobacteraceae bacterium]